LRVSEFKLLNVLEKCVQTHLAQHQQPGPNSSLFQELMSVQLRKLDEEQLKEEAENKAVNVAERARKEMERTFLIEKLQARRQAVNGGDKDDEVSGVQSDQEWWD
jgi:hypothetical protein